MLQAGTAHADKIQHGVHRAELLRCLVDPHSQICQLLVVVPQLECAVMIAGGVFPPDLHEQNVGVLVFDLAVHQFRGIVFVCHFPD